MLVTVDVHHFVFLAGVGIPSAEDFSNGRTFWRYVPAYSSSGESEQNASLFVVLNDESNTCLKITDVKEFYTASDSEIVRFSENDISEFFDGTLNTGEREIFIINLKAVKDRCPQEL